MSDVHLDDAVLKALREVMAEEFPLLLDTFVADSEERLRNLHEALAELDGQALRHAAHSFKGSCGNMGAPALAALCKRLEDAARQGDMAKATVFDVKPADQARRFVKDGFDWLHVVDLNGAMQGKAVNTEAVDAGAAGIVVVMEKSSGVGIALLRQEEVSTDLD